MGDLSKTIIEAKNLTVTFNDIKVGLKALDNIDFTIYKGQFVSILGPSGCGKSTLFKAIADLIEYSEVEADISGKLEVLGESPEFARMNRKIGVVFQKATLLEWRKIRENVELPLEIMGVSKSDRANRSTELLELVGLGDYANMRPSQLSGGMQQRISIARALAYDPDILLMDEPFSALDEIKRREMNDSLISIWEQTGKTILFVTHSIAEAVYLSERIIVLSERPGRVLGDINVNMDYPRTDKIASDTYFKYQNIIRDTLNK